MKSERVKTTSELLSKMQTANDGDVCECEETKCTYQFENNGWTCIKTSVPGYEHVYGQGKEQ